MDAFDQVLEDTRQPGLRELRELLRDLLGAPKGNCRLLDEQQLSSRHSRVFRLCFACNGEPRALIVKRLEPAIAQRNWFVTNRWLPAAGLSAGGPILLGTAAERSGQCVWHVYEDHGDGTLDATTPNRPRVRAVVELIAKVHTRFAGHLLLPECRLHGDDFGIYFFTSNVRDALRCVELLRRPAVKLSGERRAVRDRLLERLTRLVREEPARAQTLAELGGPDTLLHGDLWTTNTFVQPDANELRARLIDWDHAGVGPVSYDLSTFLLRFAPEHRGWILDFYRQAVADEGWRLPSVSDLNLLFETAELARCANRVIWPAMAIAQDQAEWGFDELAEVDEWFEELEPVLPAEKAAHNAKPAWP